MGLIPFLSPISIVKQKPDNTQSCHQSSIQLQLSRSSSALSVVKLVPPPPSPQRLVHSVFHQRRSVTISARPLVTEGSQDYRQVDHSKSSGSGLCRPIRLINDH